MKARQQRDLVLELLERTRSEYLAIARKAAFHVHALANRPITIDEVREVCPPPPDVDPRVMGAVFKKSDWYKVGYVNSKRGHARPVALFLPKNREEMKCQKK